VNYSSLKIKLSHKIISCQVELTVKKGMSDVVRLISKSPQLEGTLALHSYIIGRHVLAQASQTTANIVKYTRNQKPLINGFKINNFAKKKVHEFYHYDRYL